MKSPLRLRAARLAVFPGRYAALTLCAALALCAVLLTSAVAPSSAQRRIAIRVPAGEAAPTAAPLREKESRRETESERQREGDAARARMRAAAQSRGIVSKKGGAEVGKPTTGAVGVERTSADIMQFQSYQPNVLREPRLMKEHELPSRKNLPQDPNAKALSSYPARTTLARGVSGASPSADETTTTAAPQTVTTNFTGATLADTGAFPPDSMGAVGPSQFVVFVNGRIRTFNKGTGAADGVINADPDVFFASVLTPGFAINFTSDPQVRYDRLSGRWILTIIDVPGTASPGDAPNRILIAVSDAASNGTISAGTVWTFFFVQQNTVGGGDSLEFLEYPSLGVDVKALYIGGYMFAAAAGTFNNFAAFVIRKSSILSGGPVVTTVFRNLVTTDGPDTPRGVDNFDPAATEGYFIGPSDAAFGRLIMRRVSDPGGTPAISANISITVSATSFPITVDHLGDTGGTNGNLDALDDRLFQAHIRNGHLWTAHNLAVTAAGVASNSNTQRRDGVRWYELIVPPTTGTPTVNQSGTIFDPAATVALARQFWMPSVTVSGQGHAAIGYSTAGTPFPIDASTSGRLRTDTLGTTGANLLYTNNTTNTYNPPSDPGGTSGRRWGDYSFVSLDPQDDMTMWTIQEFCSSTNNYGVRVAKLAAPPPASPSSSSLLSIPPGLNSVLVTITGNSSNGSEFYDPGPNLAAPAVAFNHITASVTGGVTVNSVTYVDPTHVTLDLNTLVATLGGKNITITNPDGQSSTSNNVVFVGAAPPSPILVSEFRFRGSAGGNDEFIELYNNTNSPITVADSGAGTGYAVAGTNTTGTNSTRCTVPNGTVIPARGHFLCTNNGAAGYSLGGYAAGDVNYATGIVDGGGVAVFSTTVTANWGTNTRFDAVGFAGITGTTLFTEGTALTPAGGITTSTAGVEFSFVRKMTTASGGLPQDTDNNNSDFAFVATNGATISTRQSTLGAPGPENLASPIQRNSTIALTLLDPAVGSANSPNRSRDFTSDPANNSTFGTMSIRRTVTNNTGASVTRLRFRIVDITTFPTSAGVADLRARSSSAGVIGIAGTNPACPAQTCPMTPLTLETPPAQTSGGGLNSSLTAGTVALGTPLINGQSINVEFLLGVQQTGNFRFFIKIEALP
ncbi:MAG: hypothetical protein QOC61_744 [Acidobacteriota bacterium]|nr:hypothetical protein [Acidobacteriota bacterium]